MDWVTFLAGGITGMVSTFAFLSVFVDWEPGAELGNLPTNNPPHSPPVPDDPYEGLDVWGDWGHPLAAMPDDWGTR